MPISHVPEDAYQQVTAFDFRHQDDLPASDIEEFRAVQKSFGERLAAELSGYLRKDFSVALADVRQQTWKSYVSGFSEPSCFMLLKSRALPGYGTLEMSPAFVFTVLEILLGGKTDSVTAVARELTVIERKLLGGFFRCAQQRLRDAWVVDGPDFVMESLLASPAGTSEISDEEPMVLAEFLVKADSIDCHMCLAVPATFVRQRRQNPGTAATPVPNHRPAGSGGAILKRIHQATVSAETMLTKATIRVGDLATLEPGDILNLGHAVSAPLSMCINGSEIYSGFIVPAEGKRAFSIQAVKPGAHPAP